MIDDIRSALVELKYMLDLDLDMHQIKALEIAYDIVEEKLNDLEDNG